MKVSELRIGNKVYRPDLGDGHMRIESVLAIYERVKTTGPVKTIFDFEDLEPIPLTPEILEKFKLELNPFESYDCVFEMLERGLIFGTDTTFIKIEFVHQLQNFIFAITGIDPEIEL